MWRGATAKFNSAAMLRANFWCSNQRAAPARDVTWCSQDFLRSCLISVARVFKTSARAVFGVSFNAELNYLNEFPLPRV
jgi:hypothetical protein